MSELTDYAETNLIQHLLGDATWTKPNAGGGIYIMAFETLPDDAGAGGVEATYAGYSRILIPQVDANWFLQPVAEGVQCYNQVVQQFPTPTANGTALVGFGAVDAATGGNILFYSPFGLTGTPETETVTLGTAIQFPVGNLVFELTQPDIRICDDLAFDFLNHIFRTATWVKPAALTIALCEVLYGKAGTGGTEKTGDGYASPAVGPNSAIWGAGATPANLSAIDFGTPTADWNGIVGHVLKDGSKILLRQPYAATKNFLSGLQVTAPVGQIVVSAD